MLGGWMRSIRHRYHHREPETGILILIIRIVLIEVDLIIIPISVRNKRTVVDSTCQVSTQLASGASALVCMFHPLEPMLRFEDKLSSNVVVNML